MNANRKPILAVAGVALALSLTFTGLVGCKGDDNPADESTSGLPSMSDSNPVDSGSNPVDSGSTSELEYETVDETVYVVAEVSATVRKGPSLSSEVAGYVLHGESFRRVKYNASWSVIVYDGNECYIATELVSTQNPSEVTMTFDPVDYQVYVITDAANLRDVPSTENSIVKFAVEKDTALTAIGLSTDKNWYKINYTDSKTNTETICYIHASCVSTTKVGDDFTALNKTVYVTADQLNVRTLPTTGEGSVIVAALTKGTAVTVIGVNADNTWYQIKYTPAGGTEGTYYISASTKYVSDTKPAA